MTLTSPVLNVTRGVQTDSEIQQCYLVCMAYSALSTSAGFLARRQTECLPRKPVQYTMAIRPFVITSFALNMLFCSSQAGNSADFLYLLDLIEDDRVAWVDAHNYFRRQVSNPSAANMKLMSWDDDLAKFAERVVKTCSFFHTSVQDRRTKDFNPVGENLYTGGDYNFADIMTRRGVTKLWYDEIQYHDMNTLTCQTGKECGHYKQVIWATTYKVGCAIAKCRAIEGGHPPYLVACNYGPIGNAYTSDGRPLHPYLVGTPCSKCDDGDKCVDKLCNKTAQISPSVTSPMPTTISATTIMSTSSFTTSMTPTMTKVTTPMPTTTAATTVLSTPSVSITVSTPTTEGVATTGCSGKMCPTITASATPRPAINATETTVPFNATMTTEAGALRTSYGFNTLLLVALIAWLVMMK